MDQHAYGYEELCQAEPGVEGWGRTPHGGQIGEKHRETW